MSSRDCRHCLSRDEAVMAGGELIATQCSQRTWKTLGIGLSIGVGVMTDLAVLEAPQVSIKDR